MTAKASWRRWPRARQAGDGTDIASLLREIGALTEEVRALARLARTDPLTGLRTGAGGMSNSVASFPGRSAREAPCL